MATAGTMSADRIRKAFEDIDTQVTLLSDCSRLYKYLSDHFSSLQNSLLQRSQILDSKLQTLESNTDQTLESLDLRENSLPDRESAAVARLDRLKVDALAAFDNPPSGVGSDLLECLRSYCRRMDSEGLWRFLVTMRKELVSMKTEIPHALFSAAVDPMTLVLDSLEDFVSKKPGKVGLSDQRWACGLLLRALLQPPDDLVVDGADKVGPGSVPGKIAERAAAIAEAWKEKVEEKEGGAAVGASEVMMFLQLVASFGIQSKFDEEFLRNLVVRFPMRKEAAKVAVELGFGDKMTDIIDELVKSGKEIEAIYFAHESGLTDRFPPVALLKAYLKNSKKNASTVLKNGHYSQPATDEAGNLELNSLKAIIKCVEDHKLESKFALEGHRRRVAQLEKAKADRKKNTNIKSKNKRPRINGGVGSGSGSAAFPPSKTGRLSVRWELASRPNPTAGYPGAYNYPSQGVYDVSPAAAPYGSPFGSVRGQSPAVPPQQQYSYVPDDIAGARGSGPYGGPAVPAGTASYAGYDYNAGAGASLSHPSYQSSYPQ